jgi:arylsulfatase A-like enzyme
VTAPTRPYRAALGRSLGVVLLAGLVLAVLDGVAAAGATPGASTLGVVAKSVGLYAWPVLAAALAAGLVAGAFTATFGPGALRRGVAALRRDRARDREATAAVLAGFFVAAIAAGFIAALSLKLVAGVERKAVGALLVGGLAVLSLPLFAIAALPVYRAARLPARLVPPLGPLPATAVVLLLAAIGAALVGGLVVTTRLDWRVLDLGPYATLGGLAVLAAALWLLVAGPLAPLAARVPPAVALGAALVALVLPPLTLRGTPATADVAALTEHGRGARALVNLGRALLDADGDGYSAFLGGPDCDDSRADVNPAAPEIPGNGIDDNCLGGDRPLDPVASDPVAPSGDAAAPAAAQRLAFQGNLVIIAIDTLRADRLGAAGYRRDGTSLTPNLDRLIDESVYFERVWAQSPNTPRSFPSTFASRYPSQLLVDKPFANYSNPLPENVFVFEQLEDAGVVTRGHASHFYFDRAPGFAQGFTRFDNEGALDIAGSNKDIAAPRIVPRAEASLAELGKAGGRFALFVHLFEPHSTYVVHEGYTITEKGTASLAQKYDYEIAYVDGWVGKLLEAIDREGLRDRTMVVVVSDHGEAFGVHSAYGKKMFFHGQTLYDELLRVPLVVRVPGVAPRRVKDPVALVDLAPTIAEVMGVPSAPTFVGRSLVPAMLGEALPPRPIFAELLRAPSWDHEARAVISPDGKHKLIARDGGYELYDLEADPEERRDLSRSDAATLEAMKRELLRFVEVELTR